MPVSRAIARRSVHDVDGVFYFPFDLGIFVRRTLELVRPLMALTRADDAIAHNLGWAAAVFAVAALTDWLQASRFGDAINAIRQDPVLFRSLPLTRTKRPSCG